MAQCIVEAFDTPSSSAEIRGVQLPLAICANLPRHRKLLKPFEFSAVLKEGQRYAGKFVVLVVRRCPEKLARLGLAIAKKHAKLAKDRNQIKRIARESFRSLRFRLPAVEVVVLSRSRDKKAAMPDQRLLRMEFDALFDKIAARKVAACTSATPRSKPAHSNEILPNE